MKKILYSIIMFLFIFDVNAYASVTVISDDDEQTMRKSKSGKIYLNQLWYGMKFELDENLTKGDSILKRVNAEKYEKYLNEIDERFIDSVGEYQVYIIQNKLKKQSYSALSFEDNTAVVFGRYTNLSNKSIAYLATHEFGHNVDFQLMNKKLWKEYKEIRGITDENIYNDNAKEAQNRPQEIFAEDFRLLYGGAEAKIRAHENKTLPEPNEVDGLNEFFEKLI